MAKRLLAVQVGNPIIRQQATDVTKQMLKSDDFTQCVEKMTEMNVAMKGVGISANQVGYPYALSLIHIQKSKARPDMKEQPKVWMCNPKVISTSDATEYMWEGCLSVAEAKLFAKVKRYKWVRVEYMNLDGETITAKLDGIKGHVAQHEIDHLAGKVFLDQEYLKETLMSRSEYTAMRKAELKLKNKEKK